VKLLKLLLLFLNLLTKISCFVHSGIVAAPGSTSQPPPDMIPAGSPRPSGLDSTGWSPGQSSSPPPPTTSTHGQRISTPSATPSVAVSVAGGRNAQGQSALHITAAACNAAAISLLVSDRSFFNGIDLRHKFPDDAVCLICIA
jgi:hypothetical protein